jgi:hypothetical protein
MRQHRQIHVWITESDYLLLHELSAEEQESVSAILRRLIKTERHRLRDDHASPEPVPGPHIGALQ